MAGQFDRRGSFPRDAEEEGVGGVPHSVAGPLDGLLRQGAAVLGPLDSLLRQSAAVLVSCDGVRVVDEGEDGVQQIVSADLAMWGYNFSLLGSKYEELLKIDFFCLPISV